MTNVFGNVVNVKQYPLLDSNFRNHCKQKLDEDSVLVLDNFLTSLAIDSIKAEGKDNQHLAYFAEKNHNIYLLPPDPEFSPDHPRNREVVSSKGCITTDQIPDRSVLRVLYEAPQFREFLCAVLDIEELHEYVDPLSSINLHYASNGQELGWHFDNSSFAITLLIQPPEDGGSFEYVRDVRNADHGDMNYPLSQRILDGEIPPVKLSLCAGSLVLFRGRNSIHRVTPARGSQPRMLVVLAYNTEPGIALSESARMTFYGRLG